MTCTRATPGSRDRLRARGPLIADLLRGLQERPKHVSPSYFYDERGSQLFDAICQLPEYYLTRTETQILKTYVDDIVTSVGDGALLVEFGSGASTKTRLLLDHLSQVSAYVPVDISRSHLRDAALRISSAYPSIEVAPICADFTLPFDLPKLRRAATRTVVFFPGSTLGNFDSEAAVDLMRLMRDIAGPRGGLLLGTDLVKDPHVLWRAYNDTAGITAAFNLNLLERLNREFGANFDLHAFRHEAVWNAADSRIEMRLVSLRKQTVTLGGHPVHFAEGERLITEHSNKYTLEGFHEQATAAGWRLRRVWLDDRRYFAVHYLETC